MNGYEYARSVPVMCIDPSGTIVVVISGLGEEPQKGKPLSDDVRTAVFGVVAQYDKLAGATWNNGVGEKLEGGGWEKPRDNLANHFKAFKRRKKANPCSLEQFIAIGHSDGATAIYQLARDRRFDDEKGRTPAFLGLVDLVRLDLAPWKSLWFLGRTNVHDPLSARDRAKAEHERPYPNTDRGRRARAAGIPAGLMNSKDDPPAGTAIIFPPEGTRVHNHFQSSGRSGHWALWWLPIKGRYVFGAHKNYNYPNTNHMDMWNNSQRVKKRLTRNAAKYYAERVKAEAKRKGVKSWTRTWTKKDTEQW
jgi:hypothetical protein